MLLFYFYIFVIGSAIGSFLNVLIDRLSNDRSIGGRSHCDYCQKTLEFGDLVPIFSYIALNGRCRYCHKKLSLQYPLIEFVTGILFIFTWVWLGQISFLLKIAYLGLLSSLIVIFVADVKYKIIPDEVQISSLLFSFIILLCSGFSFIQLLIQFTYAVLVMCPILILFLVTKGKGMGFADVKFAFVMGLLLGLKDGLVALYFGFIFGAVIGIILLIGGKKKLKSKIAFGPFLVISLILTLLFRNNIHILISRYFYF